MLSRSEAVTNWRRDGCPFAGGQTRVLGWIARRRYAPAGTKAKFTKQLRKRLGKGATLVKEKENRTTEAVAAATAKTSAKAKAEAAAPAA